MRHFKIFFLILVVAAMAVNTQKSMHKNCMQGKTNELDINAELIDNIFLTKELLERECNKIMAQNNISKKTKGCLLRGFVKNAKFQHSSPEVKELFSLLTKTCEQAIKESGKIKFEHQEKADEFIANSINIIGM